MDSKKKTKKERAATVNEVRHCFSTFCFMSTTEVKGENRESNQKRHCFTLIAQLRLAISQEMLFYTCSYLQGSPQNKSVSYGD